MTDQRKRSDMPPVPRDYQETSFSELVPIKSSTINVFKSPIFYMVIFTAILSIALFSYGGQITTGGPNAGAAFQNLVWVTIGYLLLIVLLVVYLYSRSDKPFWAYLLNLGFVALLLSTPLQQIYFLVFREVLPGRMEWALNQENFGRAFIGMFFAAGLCEELMKVSLVLFGALIVVKASVWKQRLNPRIYDLISIRGPLDGLLMGMFGGAGFILLETGDQYVYGQISDVAQQTGDTSFGLLAGVLLLLPRTISGIVGHMGWAGITGYFIGLAVIRRVAVIKFLALAWAGTAVLHAIWNTQSFFPLFSYLSAGVTGVFLVACLLKARQLEMAMGRSVETYGSIIVRPQHKPAPAAAAAADAPGGAPAAPPTAAPPIAASPSAAPPMAPPGGMPAGTPSPARAADRATRATPPPAAGPSAQPGTAAVPHLAFADATVPVVVGQALDLSAVAAAADIRAEITRHPTRHDVLGLKNLGSAPWTAILRDGSQQPVGPDRNVRLADGVQIDFGNGVVATVRH